MDSLRSESSNVYLSHCVSNLLREAHSSLEDFRDAIKTSSRSEVRRMSRELGPLLSKLIESTEKPFRKG